MAKRGEKDTKKSPPEPEEDRDEQDESAREDEDEDEREDAEEEGSDASEESEDDEEDEEEESESDESEEEDEDEDEGDEEEEDDAAAKKKAQEEDSEEEEEEDDEEEEDEADKAPPKAAASKALAKRDDDAPPSSKGSDDGDDEASDDEEEVLPAQLGAQRYVYSAFFAATILGAYIVARAIETAWERLAISDWAVRNLPFISGVPDDSKQTYSFIAGAIIAIAVGLVQFRKESVRKWSEEVSAELLKVKWPTRKEVYASTVVVLATSAVAVVYLFLLDRFWGFVTNLIYGSGS